MEKQLAQKLLVMEDEVRRLKQRNLISFLLICSLIIFILLSAAKQRDDNQFDILTTKTLIVQDQSGRDRIIISPEIAVSKSRLRKDTLHGVLILDENGNDRVILGATPTILSNNRILRRAENDFPYGFAFNDKNGNERGGLGYYANRGLVSFGMDHPNGQEAIAMFVADTNFYGQKAGIVLSDKMGRQQVYMGTTINSEAMINMDAPSKGRLSIHIDSSARSTIKHYDYSKKTNRTLMKSE